MTNAVDLLTIENLVVHRDRADALIHSGILNPHEVAHMWKIMERMDEIVKEKRLQEQKSE
jgi:hypothetical protein